MTQNIQVNSLIRAMIESEPCLFHNSSANLMPVTEKSPNLTRQFMENEHMFAIARWHGALQAKFEVDLFGHNLYTTPVFV
jgi:hypothetical protein